MNGFGRRRRKEKMQDYTPENGKLKKLHSIKERD